MLRPVSIANALQVLPCRPLALRRDSFAAAQRKPGECETSQNGSESTSFDWIQRLHGSMRFLAAAADCVHRFMSSDAPPFAEPFSTTPPHWVVPVVAQEVANTPRPTNNTTQAKHFENDVFIVRCV